MDEMKRLLLLDAKNYDEAWDEWVRVAVRGIIFVSGKLLLIEDNKGEVKLPGGGQNAGETDADTLIREVREETGCTVLPETIRPFGTIEEKRKDLREDRIFRQFSKLYFCAVSDARGRTEYSDSEKRYGMHCRTYTLDEAIAKNRAMLDDIGEPAWNQREYKTLLLIREHTAKGKCEKAGDIPPYLRTEKNPREVRARLIQSARVLRYEITMREAERLLHTNKNADRLQSLIGELEAYYTSDEWKRDFADDEKGLLPKKLPRGVLSEDGICNLLEEYREKSK